MRAKRVLGLCDTCGFRYELKTLKKNSYGMMVCPEDWEGSYDLKNHPQNRNARLRETNFVRNARPDPNIDRNLNWEAVASNWEDVNKDWNTI
jgi:hypothetical protein